MISVNLLDAIATRIEGLFEQAPLLCAKDGSQKNVKVFPQFMPQPKGATVKPKGEAPIEPQGYGPADIENNFPCVIVKLDEATDKEEGKIDQARAVVRLLAGVYDDAPDCQGYRDALNIIEVVRQDLLSMPYRILDNKYRVEMPMTWYLFEEQPWPVFFGVLETVWEIPRPMMPRLFDLRQDKRTVIDSRVPEAQAQETRQEEYRRV